MVALPFCLIFLVPMSVVAGYMLGGAFTFITPAVVFGVIPVLDLVIGSSRRNPTMAEEAAWKEALSFRVITWLCVPLQVAVVLWGAYVVSNSAMTAREMAGFVLSVGTSSGVMGINVSHELQHRVNSAFEPLLARIMLWTVVYMHWAVEHVAGHHRHVATPEDPATARLGESFYVFWPRTVFEGIRSAWRIEQRRLERKQQSIWGIHNRLMRYLLAQLGLLGALGAVLGTAAVTYFVAQSIVAISLLEIVNYIEHYGLLRKKIEGGSYEPVSLRHSWNSSNCLTNRFLFNLQRHSDHHLKPDRRYQVLRHHQESPQFPTGYAGMILIAAIPPLWRSIMDPRVREYRLQGE